MEHHVRVHMLSAAIVIAVGIAASVVTSTVVAARAYRSHADQQAQSDHEIAVKGSARLRVRSDLAVWSIHVSGEGGELKIAYGVLEFGIDRVQAYLEAQGFGEKEITLSAINTETYFARDKDGRETRQVAGYVLSRIFTVTTPNVDRVAQAAGEVTKLLQENVRVASMCPQYSYTKIADLKVQILGNASADALSRAAEIASHAGCRVGSVRRCQMGVIQITLSNSTDVTGSGIYDTTTIDKDISVVVSLTFGIEA